MLDDDDGVATGDERIEGFEQLLDVVEVQSGGRLIENKDGRHRLFEAEEVSQLDALVFAARQGG